MSSLTARILLPWVTTAIFVPASWAGGASVCPPATTTSGLDVSNWQTVTNWSEVKSSAHQFAFVKAIQGSSATAEDPTFQSNWGAAKEAGILRSAYAFFLPDEDPKQQASAFIALLEKNGVGELPPMLDWEQSDAVSATQTVANAQVWLSQVETWLRDDQKLAWTPIIYTYASYWGTLNAPASFARYPLFIADPNDNCPVLPAPWSSWQFWQRKPGTVPGISDVADLDYFSGSLEALEAFASPGAGTSTQSQ